jgi:polar amino acid transport system substrate-binding protein
MRRRSRTVDKKKLLRFLLILAFVAATAFAIISSCMNLTARTLKIGLAESSRPLTYFDDRRNIAGFEAEYAVMLAEKLGKKAEIKLYAPADMAAALDAGAIDCVVSVRQSVHDYISAFFETAPFISYGLVFIKAPADDTIYGEEDIGGKRAGLIVDSDAELLCDELLSRYSFNVRLYDFEVQPFQDLKLKKNDVVIADELYARYMQIEDPDSYQVLDTVYNMADFGLRLSQRLTQQNALDIEEAVIALRQEVALRDLFVTWFGTDLSSAD